MKKFVAFVWTYNFFPQNFINFKNKHIVIVKFLKSLSRFYNLVYIFCENNNNNKWTKIKYFCESSIYFVRKELLHKNSHFNND